MLVLLLLIFMLSYFWFYPKLISSRENQKFRIPVKDLNEKTTKEQTELFMFNLLDVILKNNNKSRFKNKKVLAFLL